MRSIMKGEEQLRKGSCVEKIVGTFGVDWGEWESMWRGTELLHSQTLHLGEVMEEDIENQARCEEEDGHAEHETSLEDLVKSLNCRCVGDVFERVNAYSGEEKKIDEQIPHMVENLLGDLSIVGDDASDIVHDLVEEIEMGNIKDENRNDHGIHVEEESFLDDVDLYQQKSCDMNQVTQEVLLFEVVFTQNDGGSVVNAIIKLEDLKCFAPSLLLRFLQARLVAPVEGEDEED